MPAATRPLVVPVPAKLLEQLRLLALFRETDAASIAADVITTWLTDGPGRRELAGYAAAPVARITTAAPVPRPRRRRPAQQLAGQLAIAGHGFDEIPY